MISSKQRIIRALQHKQPDTIPVDFGATSVTGIHCKVVESLRAYYGLEKRPVKIIEPFQMLGEIDEELKQIMHLDCEHVFGSYDMLGNDNDRLHTQRTPWGQEVLIAQGIDLTPDRNNDIWLYPQGDRTAAPSAVLSDGCYFMNAIERCGEIDDSQMNPEDNLEEYGLVSDEELDRLSKIFDKRDVQVNEGYLNNLRLRFPNEPSRHKLLDMIGDLALIGQRIRGRIVAYKPGHAANTEFAKMIRKEIKRGGTRPMFRIDPAAKPLYDINQIKRLLPHRPPFLLVDKVMHLDSEHVVGFKNVTMNEPFFVGHFPDEPVMPGVLIVEAMAQCGGILALSSVPDPENYSTYFLKIDGVKFRDKVVPGDTLQFELTLAEPIRRGIVLMEAKAFVGNRFVTEALLMAQIAKNRVG